MSQEQLTTNASTATIAQTNLEKAIETAKVRSIGAKVNVAIFNTGFDKFTVLAMNEHSYLAKTAVPIALYSNGILASAAWKLSDMARNA